MRRPQFSLKTMLWLMACVACGLGGWIAGVRHNPLFNWQWRVIHEQEEKFEAYRRDNPRSIKLQRLGKRYLQELEQKAKDEAAAEKSLRQLHRDAQPLQDSPAEEVASDGRP